MISFAFGQKNTPGEAERVWVYAILWVVEWVFRHGTTEPSPPVLNCACATGHIPLL